MSKGWVGVDLDGTLAHYDGWKGADHIGEPGPRESPTVPNRLPSSRHGASATSAGASR